MTRRFDQCEGDRVARLFAIRAALEQGHAKADGCGSYTAPHHTNHEPPSERHGARRPMVTEGTG